MGVLSRLLDDREHGVPESELERAFLRLVRRHRLPVPVRQHPVGRYRLDFAYPDVKVAIELDGWATHGSPQRRRADLSRQNELEVLGWHVLRFTWDDVTKDPAGVALTVRAVLKRA